MTGMTDRKGLSLSRTAYRACRCLWGNGLLRALTQVRALPSSTLCCRFSCLCVAVAATRRLFFA